VAAYIGQLTKILLAIVTAKNKINYAFRLTY